MYSKAHAHADHAYLHTHIRMWNPCGHVPACPRTARARGARARRAPERRGASPAPATLRPQPAIAADSARSADADALAGAETEDTNFSAHFRISLGPAFLRHVLWLGQETKTEYSSCSIVSNRNVLMQ